MTGIAVAVSLVMYHYTVAYMRSIAIPGQRANASFKNFQLTQYIICLLLSLGFIALPFLFSLYKSALKIRRKRLTFYLALMELFGLVIAKAFTPPDLISTMIVFILWQLPVGLNMLILFRITQE